MAVDSIKRKSGTRYRVRVLLPNGKRASKVFRRMIDAKAWEAKVTLNPSSQIDRKRIRFDEFVKLFLTTHVRANVQNSSYARYESAFRMYITPWFRTIWVDEITKMQVEEFKGHIRQLDKSLDLRNFLFGIFKSLMQKAVDWDYRDRNPCSGTKPLPKGMGRTEYWSKEEVDTFLLQMLESKRLPLYLVALNTGMRIGEIFGLKWDCVDLKNRFLDVRRTFDQKIGGIKETTKTQRNRFVPINDALLKVLIELKSKATSEYVLEPKNLGCTDPSHIARAFKTDCKRAKVKVIKFHDIRHTFATTFMNSGGSIQALAGILGHTTTRMTERYAHFDRETLKRNMQFVSFETPTLAPILKICGHKLVTK